MTTNRNETSSDHMFRVFPESFFSVLSGGNRELFELALTALYKKTSYGTSYSMTFEDACAVVEEAISDRSFSIEEDEEETEESFSSDHDKALYVLRKLRLRGWINEEIGENYQRLIQFEDYATELLQTILRMSANEEQEYSGYIYTIYQLLKSVDMINGDLALERTVSNTEDLFRQLASLNTNIKKYIQRLLDEENRDNLQALMEMLLEEYQKGVVDRAYYNLTTRDHPEKFREYILEKIALIRSDQMLMDAMARSRSERKASSYEESYNRLLNQLDYVETSFSTISGLMKEIDRKNHKYVTSALARITFLLEAHEDLEGKINRILKALIHGELDPAGLFQLYQTSYLDSESLYTMKQKRLRVKQSFAEEQAIDARALNEFRELLAMEQRFSRSGVEHFILELLKDKPKIKASELDLTDLETFTYVILGYLYGHDEDCRIEIEESDEAVTAKGYKFRDFLFRRRADG
ncbi:MAG: hypothetical protein IKD68_14820 [Solobacterium sp.]|nr:hypothetical protein [Solobacterium sp.]